MFANEYELGPMFQLVNYIWRDSKEALCELVLETPQTVSEYQFYPVYFDCCIQIIASIVSGGVKRNADGSYESVTYVPIGIEKFILHETPAYDTPLYCHTVLQGEDGTDFLTQDTIRAMMCVMGEDGKVYAEAINFTVKRAGKELLMASLKEDLSSYCYDVEWKAAAIEDDTQQSETGSWVVFADTSAAAACVTPLACEENGWP